MPMWSPILLQLWAEMEDMQMYNLEGSLRGGVEATCSGTLLLILLWV